jgi:hypothetical protein
LLEVEAPTFSDIWLIHGGKVVSITRRPLFTPRNIPGTHFCQRLIRPQGHSAAGRISMLLKIPTFTLYTSLLSVQALQSRSCLTYVPTTKLLFIPHCTDHAENRVSVSFGRPLYSAVA